MADKAKDQAQPRTMPVSQPPDSPRPQPQPVPQPPTPAPRPDEPRNSSSAYTIIIDKDLLAETAPQLTIVEGNLQLSVELKPGEHIQETHETSGDPRQPDTTTITLTLPPD
jgi:hypothetical protein